MSTALGVVLLDTSDGEGRRIVAAREGEEYGYAIARWLEHADRIAAELGRPPMGRFVYQDCELYEAAIDMADREGDEELAASLRTKLEAARSQPEWHDAEQGLESVRGVLEATRDERTLVRPSEVRTTKEAVIWDLETIEAFLVDAAASSTRFRFEAV